MPLRTANVVGSGPNGLAAAITLAHAGVDVEVYERAGIPGGGVSTQELTLADFHHDVGSSVYPLGVVSPFFRTLPLEQFGLRWIEPTAPLAHPLDDGTAVTLEHNISHTCEQLGVQDGNAWRKLLEPLTTHWSDLVTAVMHPLTGLPRHPVRFARFGLDAAMPAAMLAKRHFKTERARALFAGNAAHAVLPLTRVGSSGAGLVLAAAGHTSGWPLAAGGASQLTRALAAYFNSLGGRLWLHAEVRTLADLRPADVTLFDTSTRALDRIAGAQLTAGFRTRMRHFHYGPGIFKLDWALSEPVPWAAAEVRRAGTVHIGGSLGEIIASEADAHSGRHSSTPFVLLVQPTLFDPSRAPLSAAGHQLHTLWAYSHVPNGSTVDMTATIENQIERFAPGFRDCILARSARNSEQMAAWNPNLIGGDISGGAMTLSQLLLRPTAYLYRTSNPSLYLCSASTPPGGGVHGMCGHLAARAALADHRR